MTNAIEGSFSISLPEVVATELMAAIPACANQIAPKLSELVGTQDKLRETAQQMGLIQAIGNNNLDALPVGAVDGVHDVFPTTGGDFVGVAAFRVDDLDNLTHRALVDTVAHSVEIEQILGGIRSMLEITLLAQPSPNGFD